MAKNVRELRTGTQVQKNRVWELSGLMPGSDEGENRESLGIYLDTAKRGTYNYIIVFSISAGGLMA